MTGIKLLSGLAESGNIPHALLFTGRDTDNNKAVALKFVKWLLHSHGDFVDFYKSECDCSTCIRISCATHPDFFVLDQSPIEISEIRWLKEKFSSTPLISDRKIAIICNAETLRVEAANSLLKLLEEPRGNALLILVAPTRSMVLPTIVSRTCEIRFVSNDTPRIVSGKSQVQNSGLLSDKFCLAKKYTLENKSEVVGFLDAWVEQMRGELLACPAARDKVGHIKKVLKVKQIVITTNANPSLLLEEVFLEKYA